MLIRVPVRRQAWHFNWVGWQWSRRWQWFNRGCRPRIRRRPNWRQGEHWWLKPITQWWVRRQRDIERWRRCFGYRRTTASHGWCIGGWRRADNWRSTNNGSRRHAVDWGYIDDRWAYSRRRHDDCRWHLDGWRRFDNRGHGDRWNSGLPSHSGRPCRDHAAANLRPTLVPAN